MKIHEQLTAYLATLAALVVIVIAGLVAAMNGLTNVEAFGLGGVTGGLIGILRLPASRNVQIDQPANQPVPVEEKS